jgi:alpha-2-macroglobulin
MKTPLLLCFLSVIIFFNESCRKSDEPTGDMLGDQTHELISAYTSGTINRDASIVIRLTQPVEASIASAPAKIEKYAKITPAMAGSWSLADETSIRFDPDGLWPAATQHIITVDPDGLTGMKTTGKTFSFAVFSNRPSIYLEIDALRPDPSGGFVLTGRVVSNVLLSEDESEELLTVHYNEKTVTPEWKVGGSALSREFVVDGIERGEASGRLSLQLKGTNELPADSEIKSLVIPAIDEFALLDHYLSLADPRGVVLVFSDPLDKNQELEGLIRWEEYPGQVRIVRDDSRVYIIPDEWPKGTHQIRVFNAVKSNRGIALNSAHRIPIHFTTAPPAIKWLAAGNLIPLSAQGQIPFEAVNVHHVELEIFRIKEKNVLSYLQSNAWGGDYYLEQVGRVVHSERVSLGAEGSIRLNEPGKYTLDLKNWVNREANALYEVRLGFRPGDAITGCTDGDLDGEAPGQGLNWPQGKGEDDSFWNSSYYGIGGYYEDFNWKDRDDPCKSAYYNRDRFIARSIFPVELGLLVKGNDEGAYWATVTDLESGRPAGGVAVHFYNFQREELGKAITDSDGFCRFENSGSSQAFFAEARKGNRSTFLRLPEGESNPLSSFDIGGRRVDGSFDVYLYGERDVWRPGDSIYIFGIVKTAGKEDLRKAPVRYRFRDPRGQLVSQGVLPRPDGPMVPVFLKTSAEAPTGLYTLELAVGDQVFSRTVRVETIKPNRYAFAWDDLEAPVYGWARSVFPMTVTWLHGAPAKNADVVVEESNRDLDDPFAGWAGYFFHEKRIKWPRDPEPLATGKTDDQGRIVITREPVSGKFSGPGISRWTIRASEPGGGFSVDQIERKYFPNATYAGVRLPMADGDYPSFDLGKARDIDVARVDTDGRGKAGTVRVEIDRVSWRWWWDDSGDGDWDYNSREVLEELERETVRLNAQGKGQLAFQPPTWGRYRVRVCDTESGHCAAAYAYAGRPSFDDLDRSQAARLNFVVDKTDASPGEKVRLDVPSPFAGRALVSIENGRGVLAQTWHPVQPGQNSIELSVDQTMVPAAYIHLSMVQGLTDRVEDVPARMYGVGSVRVSARKSKLDLVLDAPDEIRPARSFEVSLREKGGQPTYYSLAIVDEGLLNLTRYKTPDPWAFFHQKEALGVRTWDMFDDLILSSFSRTGKLLAVGGDADMAMAPGTQEANRFPPIVKVMGPFQLGKGKTATHKITLPNYLGAVRIMAVASTADAWGNAEKTVPVRNPVMVFSSAPRVLSPGETLLYPMTVMAGKDGIGLINWEVADENGLLSPTGPAKGQVRLNGAGEETVYIPMQAGSSEGTASILVKADGGGASVTERISIPVSNPNPIIREREGVVVEPGKSINLTYQPIGNGTSTVGSIEVMRLIPFSLEDKIDFLLQYPYGCLEQMISGAFPQLYVDQFSKLTPEHRLKRDHIITSMLSKLSNYSNSKGGLSVWPGTSYYNIWAELYAFHFMHEARERGYRVPVHLIDSWQSHAARLARSWTPPVNNKEGEVLRSTDLEQAYRLYILAEMGAPETGAMNVLRELKSTSKEALYFLAAAYAVIGRKDAATEIIAKTEFAKKDPFGYRSYGSDLRNQSLILLSLVEAGEQKQAMDMVHQIGKSFDRKRQFNTQEAAFTLMALGEFAKTSPSEGKLHFTWQTDATQQETVQSGALREQITLSNPMGEKTITVQNNGTAAIFVYLTKSGQPVSRQLEASTSGLRIERRFTDLSGRAIDVTKLNTGEEFMVTIDVTRGGVTGTGMLRDLAMSFVMASGWELLDGTSTVPTLQSGLQYLDQRDDRVNAFFNMSGGTQRFTFRMRAAYPGSYYLPPTRVEAMYEPGIAGRTSGSEVSVLR